MSFKVSLRLYTPWCLLALWSCSTAPYNSLSLYNPTGEYIARLYDEEEISGIAKSKGGDAWASEELKKIFASVSIIGKISTTETLLISEPGYCDVSACEEDSVKGQSWIYDEKDNTLVRVRQITSDNSNYADEGQLDDLELDNSLYHIDAYSSDDDAADDNKKGSKYYWVGENKYWAQSKHRTHGKETPTKDQCSDDRKRRFVVKYSIKVSENGNEHWKRRNLNECFYEDTRRPKLLYLDADNLITYTKHALIYFNDGYPGGMIIPPSSDDENKFITTFFHDADEIQAGLGERESFWVKNGDKALMFHRNSTEGNEQDDQVVWSYTKFNLNISEDKMAMWVDREQDGDADSKVLVSGKIIYIQGGKLISVKARTDKVYSKAEEKDDDDDDDDS